MRTHLFTSLLILAVAAPLAAQSSYAGMESRSIKALSDEEVKKYREGAGMGLAMPAELNGYPGPKHILELADSLQLKNEQRAKIQAIFDRMHRKASETGARIVELESALDGAFKLETVTPESLQKMTADIATLQGGLRFVHLVAHIEARALLTPHQRHEYARLRGYSDGASHQHKGH